MKVDPETPGAPDAPAPDAPEATAPDAPAADAPEASADPEPDPPTASAPSAAFGVLTADAADLGLVAGQVVRGDPAAVAARADVRPATESEVILSAPFHFPLPA